MYSLGVQAFLAIVETGSLNKAAELLNLSQGAVSYRLKMLEQEMGICLIERSRGVSKVRLTPTGETFIVLAERWNLLEQETELLQRTGAQMSLTISAADSLNIYVLPPLYQALRRHTPPVRLQIRTQHTGEAFESVGRKEADVAFVVREAAVDGNLRLEPFYTEQMVLLRLAGQDRPAMEPVAPHSLAPEHELYMNWSTGYQSWHDRWWSKVCPGRIKLDAAGLIAVLLQERQQWAIVPLSVGNILQQTGQFVLQQLTEEPPVRQCYMVTHLYPGQVAQSALAILNHYRFRLFPLTKEL